MQLVRETDIINKADMNSLVVLPEVVDLVVVLLDGEGLAVVDSVVEGGGGEEEAVVEGGV